MLGEISQMFMPPPNPKIYHIVHLDRLQSIISDGFLWCDAEILRRSPKGTTIGMTTIKQRRLNLTLSSLPGKGLRVGECVPFYFCPRSIMLYLIQQANHPDLAYRSGQELIIHLEADVNCVVQWLNDKNKRWAFTLSNAGASYFEDRCQLSQLSEVNWMAVQSNNWSGKGISPAIKEGKQAEFLVEFSFPWELVERIGVQSNKVFDNVVQLMSKGQHKPRLEIKKDWYY